MAEGGFRFLTQEQFLALDPVEKGRYLLAVSRQLAEYQDAIRDQILRMTMESRPALAKLD